MKEIICIGNSSIDTIVFDKKRYKKKGGIHYISKILSENKIKHRIIGVVGDDFNFKDSPYADVSYLQRSKTTTSILIDKDKNDVKLFSYSGKINTNLPKDLLENSIVIISTIFEDISLNFVNKLKKDYNAKIFLDVQGFTRDYNDKGEILRKIFDPSLLKDIDVLKLNKSEFNLLFKDQEKMISEAIKLNIKIIILTLGKEGIKYYNNKKIVYLKTQPIETVENIGSGDRILAGFFSKVYWGMDDLEAIKESQKEVLENLKKNGK